MRTRNKRGAVAVLAGLLGLSALGRADDPEKLIRNAVERNTLNQPGTKPFHLKAVLAPSYERDRGSNRTGEVEIWWASPKEWKREVRSPEFHQIAIVNGGKEWQKNEGDYFPEWLRETSVALIEPVPSLDQVLALVKDGDVKQLMGITNFSWTVTTTDGTAKMEIGGAISIINSTGLLQGSSGLGWSGFYQDYKSFHGRMVAHKVGVGWPEVTATVVSLEDLRDTPPGLFDAAASGGDAELLNTVVLEEMALRKNLLPSEPVLWPALKDGPLTGGVTAEVVVDRAGKVRQMSSIISNNPGLSETAGRAIVALQFKPYVQDGAPVQVVSTITMPFKTVRPGGVEAFDSAHEYFERGRHVSFPASGSGPAYVLHATFQTKNAAGAVEEGQYVDTWKSDSQWRREATLGKSRCVRARNGETLYQLMEGPDAKLLHLVLKLMEPIPAIDTFVESDWRIQRDSVKSVKTIRVLAGYEGPSGDFDPEHSVGYWFDASGKLVKTYFAGIETRRGDFADFDGFQVAHTVQVLQKGSLGMVIHVTDVSAAGTEPDSTFKVPGHEWKRAFTAEVR
jgi:Gram-negative bacterial TonB protein C-terminal